MVLLCVHEKDFFLSTHTPGDCFACYVLTNKLVSILGTLLWYAARRGSSVKKPGNAGGEGHFTSCPNWMCAPRPRKGSIK